MYGDVRWLSRSQLLEQRPGPRAVASLKGLAPSAYSGCAASSRCGRPVLLPPAPAGQTPSTTTTGHDHRRAVLAHLRLDPFPLFFLRQIIFHASSPTSCRRPPAAGAALRAPHPPRSPARNAGTRSDPPRSRKGFIATTPRASSSSPMISARAAPLWSARRNCALKLPPPRFSSNAQPRAARRAASRRCASARAARRARR